MAKITITTNDGEVVHVITENQGVEAYVDEHKVSDVGLSEFDLTKNGPAFQNRNAIEWLGEEIANAVRQARRMDG